MDRQGKSLIHKLHPVKMQILSPLAYIITVNKTIHEQYNTQYDNEDEIMKDRKWMMMIIIVKGIYNPQYLPTDFFALSTFLDKLKPSHINLSIQICP